MTLAEEIQELRDRSLNALKHAHDYYEDTRQAWQFVLVSIDRGEPIRWENQKTGTTRNATDLESKAYDYFRVELSETTFLQFIAIFEGFIADLLRLWLSASPERIPEKKPIEFQVVLDSPDKAAIVSYVVEREVIRILYSKPADWFAAFKNKWGWEYADSSDDIPRFAEAKARRDLFVHNNGIANKLYEEKAGALAQFRAGDPVNIDAPYHQEIWELLCKMIKGLAEAATSKTKNPS